MFQDSTLHFLWVVFMCFEILHCKVSNQSHILLFQAKRTETLNFKREFRSCRNRLQSQMLVRCISTLFSFHINTNVAGVSDVEEQWFGQEKSLCSALGETKQPALSLERSCSEEVALKRVK